MSVLKNIRHLSDMEYYKNAIYIRHDITMLLLHNFGTNKKIRNIKYVIPNIDKEDEKSINAIFEKYQLSEKFNSEMPEWFLTQEKTFISKELWNLIVYITEANSIYPVFVSEWDLRRQYQDKAIGCCYGLFQELQYIQSTFPQNLNMIEKLLTDIEREVQLLKGWRQSDNKRRNFKTA